MYVLFGDTVVDSKEIKTIIEEKCEFKVVKDMSKGSKREDILAYNLSIGTDRLHEIAKEQQQIGEQIDGKLTEEEMFDKYLNLAEGLTTEIKKVLPKEAIMDGMAYKWDKSDEDIKLVIAITHKEVGERKLKDVMKTLMRQVE